MALLFVFDLDDVLYSYDWRGRMQRLSEHTGLEVGELRRRWWHMEGEGAAEAGLYATADEYHLAATTALGVTVSVEDWLAIRRSAMALMPESIAAAERAAELGAMSLLTNNGALIGAHLPALASEILPLFGAEHLRASSYYGARKPDRLVFERMLASYDADPTQVFFADDREENVVAAREAGITGHHFREAAELLTAIESFAAERARI